MEADEVNEARRIGKLVAGYIKGNLGSFEKKQLDEWVAKDDRNRELFEKLTEGKNIEASMQWLSDLNMEEIADRIGVISSALTKGPV